MGDRTKNHIRIIKVIPKLLIIKLIRFLVKNHFNLVRIDSVFSSCLLNNLLLRCLSGNDKNLCCIRIEAPANRIILICIKCTILNKISAECEI